MNFLRIQIFTLCVCAYVHAYSQKPQLKDTVIVLKNVIVNSNRIEQFTSSNHIQKIDSSLKKTFTYDNITELLSLSTQCNINSYGPGGLASCTMRGTSSNHTATVWNGFNIESPNSGQQSFSMIPSVFVDDISLQYGGNSAMYGSGAIGGVVSLTSKAEEINGLSLKANFTGGSYNYKYGSLSIEHGYKKIFSSVRIFSNSCDNDFNYYSVYKTLVKQQNAAYNQQGVLVSELYKVNSKNQINFNYWYYNSSNEDPPTMLNTLSLASENKSSQRATIDWKYSNKNFTLNFRNGIFDEKLLYKDPMLKLNSNTNSNTIINEIENLWSIGKKQILSFVVNHTYEEGYSENFGGNIIRNRYAGVANYKLYLRRFSIYFSARAENIENKWSPATYSIGSGYKLTKNFNFKANVSKNYRLPTFNDLYWGAWGNPNLKPENGITEEAGVEAFNNINSSKLESNLTFYNSNINDLIVWTPEGSMWTPMNVNKVWSRGIEWSEKLNFKVSKVHCTIGLNYNYTLSTNDLKSDANYGNQLIYVPIYKANVFTTIIYKNFSMIYSHQYCGNRYYANDNSLVVKAYDLGNFQANYKLDFCKKYSAKFYFKINNIWNKDYQVVAWYAMPLRYYQFGVEINFININK